MSNPLSLGLAQSSAAVALASVLRSVHDDPAGDAAGLGDRYAPHLSPHADLLTQLQRQGPQEIQPHCALLVRLAGTGPVPPRLDEDLAGLREAARSVYDYLEGALPGGEKARMMSALAAASGPASEERTPSRLWLQESYSQFSERLRERIRAMAEDRRGARSLEVWEDSNYLRRLVIALAIDIFQKEIAPEEDLLLKGRGLLRASHRQTVDDLREIVAWLAGAPQEYVHNFVKIMMRDEWMKKKKIVFVHEVVSLMNRIAGTSFLLLTVEVRNRQGNKDYHWHVRRLVEDPKILQRMEAIITDGDAVRRIVVASGLSRDVLFSSEASLVGGLADAFAYLNPLDNPQGDPDLSPEGIRKRYKYLGAILAPFLQRQPIVNPHHFFYHILPSRGIDRIVLGRLMEEINRVWGTRFQRILGKRIVERGTACCLPEKWAPGDLVVYPGKWVGEVQGTGKTQIGGKEEEVVIVRHRSAFNQCLVKLPVAGTGHETIRPLSSRADVEMAMSIMRGEKETPELQEPPRQQCTQWLSEGSLQSLAFLLWYVSVKSRREALRTDRNKLIDVALRLAATEMALIQGLPVTVVLRSLLDLLKLDEKSEECLLHVRLMLAPK